MKFRNLEIPPEAADDADLIFAGEYDIPLNPPPKTVLDAGANVGLFSSWALERWPGARISAYEPWPENSDLLLGNVGSQIEDIYQMALWDKTGYDFMHAGRNAMCHSMLDPLGIKPGQNVRTQDAATIGSYEFVKVDTEGAELTILGRLDLSQTRAIAVEAHSEVDSRRIVQLITDKGFGVWDHRPTLNGCSLIKFIRRSEIKGIKLFVAIPTYGGAPTVFWQQVIKLLANPPCSMAVKPLPGDSLVCRARNTLTAEFLRSDCTDLLFIDSDLIFSPQHVARIVSHDVDLVAGFYPKKQDGALNWVCNAIPGKTPNEVGLQEVRYMGTGFMRIRRPVFEKMGTLQLGRAYRPDHARELTERDFWRVGVHGDRYLSEDWYFCQNWHDCGGKVYGDTRIVLKHIGEAIYPLESQISQINKPIQ